MKTEKMSFKNIKDVLSRDEMKKIMAGSGETYVCCNSMQYCFSSMGPAWAWCQNTLGCYSCQTFNAK